MPIQRKSFTNLILTVLLLWGFSHAEDLNKVQIRTQKVTDGVYMLVGRGGNIGIFVGEDGVFMIDDQYAPLTDKIKAAISAISSQPIRFVLNTHWYQDHTGGNENFGEAGAVIIAHENVRKRLSTDQCVEFFNLTIPRLPKAGLPVITFTKDVTFHLNDEEISVFHISHAHTDGDAIVYFCKANVLHTGDIYFAAMYPYIDIPSGGSITGLLGAINQILPMINEETKIIPGHGPLSNQHKFTIYRDMLATIGNRINQYIKAGKGLKEIIATKPTRDFDAEWGQGFLKPDQFVEIVYQSLIKTKK